MYTLLFVMDVRAVSNSFFLIFNKKGELIIQVWLPMVYGNLQLMGSGKVCLFGWTPYAEMTYDDDEIDIYKQDISYTQLKQIRSSASYQANKSHELWECKFPKEYYFKQYWVE